MADQLWLTPMVWTAALLASEWTDAALSASEELDAMIDAQLLWPKKSVSRAGRRSVCSASSSAMVSSLRIGVHLPPWRDGMSTQESEPRVTPA